MSEPIRLAKRLAQQLGCSRREAELYIEGGWVSVDGQVVEQPQFRVADQAVILHPDASLKQAEPVTLLWHKPAGQDASLAAAIPLLNANTHAADDASGIALLQRHFSHHAAPAPLDINASGLVVFTQDERIARKLVQDAALIEHEIIVEVSGQIAPNGLKLLNHGLKLNGRDLPPIKVSWQNETRLRFAIKAMQPNQIVQMCARVGLTVVGQKRIRIGRIAMGKLAVGQWRYLPEGERF
jgi:23S rRNA pseudouridine2604 synthase